MSWPQDKGDAIQCYLMQPWIKCPGQYLPVYMAQLTLGPSPLQLE